MSYYHHQVMRKCVSVCGVGGDKELFGDNQRQRGAGRKWQLWMGTRLLY